MTDQKRERDEQKQSTQPGPSTNREPVPDGLEGSINEGEGDSRSGGHTADRAEGNERRSDEN